MRTVGYVPPVYQLDAMNENMSRRRRSNELNYRRQVYETIENNNEYMFGEMLDNEMNNLRTYNIHRMSEVY